MTSTMAIEQRFASKVDRSAGPDACWPFSGATQGSYGAFWDGERQIGAHRYALALALGRPIPAGIEACHRCDNRICCNPRHLFEGTRAVNAADMAAKGRASRASHPVPGIRNGRAKLTAADVATIRASLEPNTHLAPRFGVCDAQISRIRRGVQWAQSGVTSVPRSSTVHAEHSSTPARTADGSVVPDPSTSEAVDPPGGRLSSSPAASGVGTRSGPPATSHVSVERVGGARAEAQLALALGSAPAT